MNKNASKTFTIESLLSSDTNNPKTVASDMCPITNVSPSYTEDSSFILKPVAVKPILRDHSSTLFQALSAHLAERPNTNAVFRPNAYPASPQTVPMNLHIKRSKSEVASRQDDLISDSTLHLTSKRHHSDPIDDYSRERSVTELTSKDKFADECVSGVRPTSFPSISFLAGNNQAVQADNMSFNNDTVLSRHSDWSVPHNQKGFNAENLGVGHRLLPFAHHSREISFNLQSPAVAPISTIITSPRVSVLPIASSTTPQSPGALLKNIHQVVNPNMLERIASCNENFFDSSLRQLFERRPASNTHWPNCHIYEPGSRFPVSAPIGIAGLDVTRSRRRGGQVRFTAEQSRQLEHVFEGQKYITPAQRRQIADKLGLQEKQVKTWFQNRRAKWRKVDHKSSSEGDGTLASTSGLPSTLQASSPDTDHTSIETSEDTNFAVQQQARPTVCIKGRLLSTVQELEASPRQQYSSDLEEIIEDRDEEHP